MNWTNRTTTFIAALRTTLLLCALLFTTNIFPADPAPEWWEQWLKDDGTLVIDGSKNGEENPPIIADKPLDDLALAGITITGATLQINKYVMLHLSGEGTKTITIEQDGTLVIAATLGTGIYSGDPWWEPLSENEDPIEITRTTLQIDGGTIKIIKIIDDVIIDEDHVLYADTIDTQIGKGGATIEIEAGVTFQSGTITGTKGGNVTKTGEGTFQVAENGGTSVIMDGDFTIKAGTVEFLGEAAISKVLDVQNGKVSFAGDAAIGTIKSAAGTIISGLVQTGSDDDGNPVMTTTKANMTITSTGNEIEGTLQNIGTLQIAKGGTIKGLLEDIDNLIVGDGNSAATLEFSGSALIVEDVPVFRPHTIGKIGVAMGAVLDLKEGAAIELSPADRSGDYDDIVIEGRLRVSSAALGIYKGDDISNPGSTYLTVAGQRNPYSGEVVGGIVEIYKSDPASNEHEVLTADTLHTRVIGIGKIIVGSGVTFQSGHITSHPDAAGASVIVSGGGTYMAAAVNIGEGYFKVEKNTTADLLEGITAGVLWGETDSQINIHDGEAEFDAISLAGKYDGNNTNLTVRQGGTLAGQITGVDKLTLGGSLSLGIEQGKTTLSVNSVDFLTPDTTTIRAFSEVYTGASDTKRYNSVIKVHDTDGNREELLNVLNSSKTALYHPVWENDGENFHLNLTVLSMHDYISREWRRGGRNIHSAGALIEAVSPVIIRESEYGQETFRTQLEGLSDAQLQGVVRTALAGELAGNAFRFAMHQPANSVFRHLDTVAPLRSPFGITRGQVREGFNVWFNPYGQVERAASGADTFDGYNMTRFGFHVGGDIEIYRHAVLGTFFGYAVPTVNSDLGKISANDYTAGLYLRVPAVWEVQLNMMIGFGSQDYSYKHVYGTTDFRGNSLFSNIELLRPFRFNDNTFTPLVAMDFQSAAMDGFIMQNPHIGGMFVEPNAMSSVIARVGMQYAFKERFHTRFQYKRLVAGEETASSKTSVVWYPSATTQVGGTQWGKDWVNVGLGGEVWRTQHWRIIADYNFDWGKRTTSHLGSVNFRFEW